MKAASLQGPPSYLAGEYVVKLFLKHHGLAIVMFGVFLAALGGMSLAGWLSYNDQLAEHGEATISYAKYLWTGEFYEAVFENWESEFLQMWALVILTVFLYQKGSIDSKPLKGKALQDTTSRLSIVRAHTWRTKMKAAGHSLYAHSLGISLLLLFLISFTLHAVGGTKAYNEEATHHGQPLVTIGEYVFSSQFWFESFQNWQSEFLAVGVLLILSVYLRERGSQQSKPVGKKYDEKTGE